MLKAALLLLMLVTPAVAQDAQRAAGAIPFMAERAARDAVEVAVCLGDAAGTKRSLDEKTKILDGLTQELGELKRKIEYNKTVGIIDPAACADDQATETCKLVKREENLRHVSTACFNDKTLLKEQLDAAVQQITDLRKQVENLSTARSAPPP